VPVGPAQAGLRKSDVALWILFPAAAVMTFMGVTNQLCLEIASIPFLWIVPLSLYLMTLVLCFGSERLYRRGPFMTLAVASLAWLALAGDPALSARLGLAPHDAVGGSIVRYCAALFFGCMVAHGELHRLRPGPARLTAFYLCVAGGGALGGLFVGLVAPRIFDAYHELPLGGAACWALALVAIARAPSGPFAGRRRGAAWGGLALVTAGALVALALGAVRVEPGTLAAERTFFGILRVIETPGRTPFVVLRHGTTRHGYQYRDAGLRERPTSYYGPSTGIGLVLAERTRAGVAPARIGVVGLGIGTLAAYGRAGDELVFYEIDPEVVRIARDSGYFSYLGDSAAALEIVTGDARLSLERELAQGRPRGFDVLVVDAFTSDSVPLHLLTREAFRAYAAHLAEDGVLAVHVSNRNFDLAAPVARLGGEVDLSASLVVNRAAPRLLTETSRWVVLARSPGRLAALGAQAARFAKPEGQPLVRVFPLEPTWIARVALWTDDFSNVMPLLRLAEGLEPLACGAACR
jgi:hypothetical protein